MYPLQTFLNVHNYIYTTSKLINLLKKILKDKTKRSNQFEQHDLTGCNILKKNKVRDLNFYPHS